MRFRVGGLLFAGHVSGAGLDLGGTADAQRGTGAGVGHQVQVAVDLACGVAPGEHDVAIAGAAALPGSRPSCRYRRPQRC